MLAENPADFGGRKEDEIGLFVGKERVDRDLVAQIQFLMRAGEQVVVAPAQQLAMDGRSGQAPMSSDVDAAVGIHEGLRAG